MATINQALDILRKAGLNINITTEKDLDYFYKDNKVVTIEIPSGALVNKEIEGTVKFPETHYSVYKGFSSQAERIVEVVDQKAKNLKDFQNQFFGTYKIPEVREIRYNGPATIVFWEDNTKTVVKVQPGEEYYDPDKAFAMAVCKKLFGNKFNRHLTKAQKAFEKSCEEEYEKERKKFDKISIANFLNLFNPSEGKKEE